MQFLWHGSPTDNIDPICQEGFDLSRSNPDGLLGAGCYFAKAASFSHRYTGDVHVVGKSSVSLHITLSSLNIDCIQMQAIKMNAVTEFVCLPFS